MSVLTLPSSGVTSPSRQRPSDTWSFQCSACGKCCNSAPALSLPELLHHEHRFIGALSIRRLQSVSLRQSLGVEPHRVRVDAELLRAFHALRQDLWHSARGTQGPVSVLLCLQGYDVPSHGRCPALGSDMRCTIHDDRKPLGCSAVPLDPLLPDSMQGLVLAERRLDADFLGAGCVKNGQHPGSLPMVIGPRVVSKADRQALVDRRRALASEKRHWGNAVFKQLEADLFARADRVAELPDAGLLVMSMVPVLLVVAAVSAPCHTRCIQYVAAQAGLLERTISDLRVVPNDLLAIARANLALQRALQSGQALPQSRAAESAAVEKWLGLDAKKPT